MRLVIGVFFLMVVLLAGCAQEDAPEAPEVAEDPVTVDSLAIVNPWASVGSEGGTAAGYFVIENGDAKADTLLSASSPDMRRVEIHETFEREDGLSGMRSVEQLPVGSGDRVRFQPGGLHLMLVELDRALATGDSVAVTLTFARQGDIALQFPVRDRQ